MLWVSLAELFGLSVWFSGTAVAPELVAAYHHPGLNVVWLTITVQIGFIAGALLSSYFGLSDRFSARRIFVVCAMVAALLNICLCLVQIAWVGIAIRLLTGVTLAGVYPTAVKILSLFFRTKRGIGIGVIIGALTLGSNMPHFILFLTSTVNWQRMIVVSSILALLASLIMWLFVPELHEGSQVQAKAGTRTKAEAASQAGSQADIQADSQAGRVKPAAEDKAVSMVHLRQALSNRGVMLSNFGYFGHMWELYAAWTWLPTFLVANARNNTVGSITSFITIGVCGALGCVLGGIIADKIGKAKLTVMAMSISAVCSVLMGLTYQRNWVLTVIVAAIWGFSVIADSAQFSALVTDYAGKEYVGTALAFQMSIGFLITTVSIYLLPVIVSWLTWRYAFSVLCIGPLLGILAMRKLARFPNECVAQEFRKASIVE